MYRLITTIIFFSFYGDPAFGCGSSLCGCSTSVRFIFGTVVVDTNNQNIEGVDLFCAGEEVLMDRTNANGEASFNTVVGHSPGCGQGRCATLRFVDSKGKHESLTVSSRTSNGKVVVLNTKIEGSN